MVKRNKVSKQKIKYHIKHKSKLVLLLIIKIFLVFLTSILILGGAYLLLNDVLNLTLVFVISFAIASIVYLFLIIKVLKLFKF